MTLRTLQRVVAKVTLGSEEDYWAGATKDLNQFNTLYAQVEKSPQDAKLLRKCVAGINKLLPLAVWAKKCLTSSDYSDLLVAMRLISKLAKDKEAGQDQLLVGIEAYKDATQKALDSTAPESFTYQGFKVSNEQHFSDELCRKALGGLDFLKALFKKRGVVNLIEDGISRVVLVHEAGGAVAYFHSGTREMVVSIAEVSKESKARVLSDFINETILHEFGHYVHRNYITGEARDAWDDPWGDLPSLADPNAPRVPDSKRKEQLDPLEIVTEYGKVDKYEDFAETFLVFMAAPERLTPTSKFRMQRALSLSGLYGKPILRLSTENQAVRVAARFLRSQV